MNKKEKKGRPRNPDGTFKPSGTPKPAKKQKPPKTMPKNRGGRPRVELDFELVDNLCGMMCTAEEICAAMGISMDTLERRTKEIHPDGLADYIKKKAGKGRASLRRAQWKTALGGNTTMQIWLGKQHLGQTDKANFEHSGPEGSAIPVKIRFVEPKGEK